jgi:hypothetical protein
MTIFDENRWQTYWTDLHRHFIGRTSDPPDNRTLGLSLCQGTAPISTLIISYSLGIWSIFHNGYTIYDACTLSRIQHWAVLLCTLFIRTNFNWPYMVSWPLNCLFNKFSTAFICYAINIECGRSYTDKYQLKRKWALLFARYRSVTSF